MLDPVRRGRGKSVVGSEGIIIILHRQPLQIQSGIEVTLVCLYQYTVSMQCLAIGVCYIPSVWIPIVLVLGKELLMEEFE